MNYQGLLLPFCRSSFSYITQPMIWQTLIWFCSLATKFPSTLQQRRGVHFQILIFFKRYRSGCGYSPNLCFHTYSFAKCFHT